MSTVPLLKSWKGPESRLLEEGNIPKQTTVILFLPRSEYLKTQELLRLLEVQNSTLNIGAWRVLNSKQESERTFPKIGIDSQSEGE